MTDEPKTKMDVVRVPMIDTGIGIEAGYANDQELIEAAKAQREELKALVSPETWARFEELERAEERRFLFGEGRVNP